MKNILSIFFVFGALFLKAQSPNIELTQVSSGFNTITCLAHCNDNRVFVLEQAGKIKFFDPYLGGNIEFLDIQARVNDSGNERGLLGLAFPTDYKQTGKFYVNYTASGGTTRISRFSVSASDSNAADPNSEEILLAITQPFSNHNGGNILFGPDGYLYIGMGDGGSGGDPNNYSQNRQSLLGKMLRIDVSGESGYTIPADNPFVGTNDPNNLVLDEIWSIGVRNPWKYSFDRLSGDLWIADVGQDAQEEVNFQAAASLGGENYGWRCYEGTANFNTSGCTGSSNYEFPIFTFNHSASNGCSITGGFVYRGVFAGELYGRYLVTDYCSGRIWSILQEDETTFSNIDHGQFNTFTYTAFGEDKYGELYLARQNGIIYRIGAINSDPSAIINPSFTSLCPGETLTLETQFNPLLSYNWFKDGNLILGANSSTFEVSEVGSYSVQVIVENDASSISEERVITIAPEPPVLTASAELEVLCDDAAFPVSLTGAPIGGTFSGVGVVNASFDPFDLPPGDYDISYNYTSAEGCNSEPVEFTIIIRELPEVSIEGIDEIYCANIDIAVMPTLIPEGGLFSGPGVSNGLFSPSSADIGENELSYTYSDAFGCANTTSITVTVDECLGLSSFENSIQVQPNPTSGSLLVKVPKTESNLLIYKMINSLGQIVITPTRINNSTSESFTIDLYDLSSGIYFLEIEDGVKTYRTAIIKQ
ncbi:MAG: PQQ-dependent sugar dehydrogenase [Bacteroidia bacterium]